VLKTGRPSIMLLISSVFYKSWFILWWKPVPILSTFLSLSFSKWCMDNIAAALWLCMKMWWRKSSAVSIFTFVRKQTFSSRLISHFLFKHKSQIVTWFIYSGSTTAVHAEHFFRSYSNIWATKVARRDNTINFFLSSPSLTYLNDSSTTRFVKSFR
jgi:hypothetical protein